MRGEGNARNKWFAAEEKSGTYILTAAGKKEMDKAMKSENEGGSSGGDSGGSGC